MRLGSRNRPGVDRVRKQTQRVYQGGGGTLSLRKKGRCTATHHPRFDSPKESPQPAPQPVLFGSCTHAEVILNPLPKQLPPGMDKKRRGKQRPRGNDQGSSPAQACGARLASPPPIHYHGAAANPHHPHPTKCRHKQKASLAGISISSL